MRWPALERPRRLWWALGAAAVVALLWWGGPALGRRMAFFRVRRVELVGVRHLPRQTLLDVMRLGPRASIFDDPAPLARRLERIIGVREARVTRRLPGTLVVTVVEATPVALTPRVAGRAAGGNAAGGPATGGPAAGLAMIDARGRVLPFDPALSAPDLPVVPAADSLVGRLLGEMRETVPALFARVATARRGGRDVVLEVDGRRLWFRPEATAEEMRAVMAVAQDLARQGKAYAELDGRFAGQVVVRWGSGGGGGGGA